MTNMDDALSNNLQQMLKGLDLKSKHDLIENFLETHKSDICLDSLYLKLQKLGFVLDFKRKVNLPFLLKLFYLDEYS